MSDRDSATQALDHLTSIDPATLDEAARATHEQAVSQVEALVELLDEDGTPDEEQDATAPDVPDDWDDEEWDDSIDDAYEKAQISRSKGTVTTKTIDGRQYYYLQWREGDTVTSQYIGPVDPA
ncbi:hypothetical protein ACOZ4I_19895 (plasmid) [Haloarcula salina]|uniref:hypothetical protein n=1 Tax=Haloarcula salina TaxID=1429914 RepID=UPI003C6F2049